MNRGRMSLGLWLVVIGTLLVLTNLGWLDRTFWLAVLELWPLLLIVFGLHLVLSRTMFWMVPALVGVALAGAIFVFGTDIPFIPLTNNTRVVEAFQYSVEPEVEKLDIRIDVGAADLALRRSDDGSVSGRLVGSRLPVVTHRTLGNDVRLTLSQQRPWLGLFDGLARWDVFVPEHVPVALELDGGAGVFDLDLRGLDVRSLVLRGGAARFDLQFDAAGSHTTVRTDSRIASIRLQVPREVGLRVYINRKLIEHNLSTAGLLRQNNWWQTPGYEQSERTIEVYVDAVLGNFEVIRD